MPLLEARHDFPHPVESDPAWSESWYFNTYSPKSRAGFVTRVGIRPHEGSVHALVVLWLPDGSTARLEEHRAEREVRDDGTWTEHVRYQRIEPLRSWQVRLGPMTLDGRRIALDARFTALGPAVGIDRTGPGAESGDAARDTVRRSLASGHLEQPGSWSGSLEVDGERFSLEGFGNRDKSWGPRDTAGRGLRMWRWFSINFGSDLHFGGILAGTAQGDLHRGWVQDRGKTTSVRRWQLSTAVADDGLTHRSLELSVLDADGETRRLHGEVERVVAIGIGEAAGLTILEGLTRFEIDGREGWGIAEYAHSLDPVTSRPVVPIA